MTERGKRIFSKLREEIDAIVLINADEPNLDMAFSYAAGTEAGLFEGCVTVIDPDGKVRMLSSILEETSARRSKAEVTVFQGAEDKIDLMKDDPVVIADGPFKDLEGKVGDIDEERGKVKVLVSMFGRETPVELDFLQVEKL